MTQPFYVAPEQVMKDRADYARKGISRGRSLIGMSCGEAILICAENPSRLLRKISEIYDRIAFAGVGKYNEFDQLRIAGVRSADLKGYAYSREDVDGRSLANGYAQMLGNVFTHEMKPMEVEILVAEVSGVPSDDRLFHILYDGTLIDQSGFTVLGGDADAVRDRVSAEFEGTPDLATGLRLAAAALAGPERALSASDLEVAVLDRQVEHRSFRRLAEGEVDEILGGHVGGATAQTEVESVPEAADLPLAATVTTDTGATDLATAEPRQATGVSSPSESSESKAESDDDEAAGT